MANKRAREEQEQLEDALHRLQRLKTGHTQEPENCGAVGHPGSYYDAPAADPLRPTNPPAAPRAGFPLLAGEALAEPYKQQLQQQHVAADLEGTQQQSQPQYEGMYWESYEQASLALRQLHFERMQRHGLAAAPPG